MLEYLDKTLLQDGFEYLVNHPDERADMIFIKSHFYKYLDIYQITDFECWMNEYVGLMNDFHRREVINGEWMPPKLANWQGLTNYEVFKELNDVFKSFKIK